MANPRIPKAFQSDLKTKANSSDQMLPVGLGIVTMPSALELS
jgi:hypothetical protein